MFFLGRSAKQRCQSSSHRNAGNQGYLATHVPWACLFVFTGSALNHGMTRGNEGRIRGLLKSRGEQRSIHETDSHDWGKGECLRSDSATCTGHPPLPGEFSPFLGGFLPGYPLGAHVQVRGGVQGNGNMGLCAPEPCASPTTVVAGGEWTHFAQVKPQLLVSQPVLHPWVDPSGQLSNPSLAQWGPHSRLSHTVLEAVRALSGQTSISPSPERSGSPMDMDMSPSRAATAPTDFPELQTFPTQQLQELLTSKEAFQKLVDSYVEKSQPVVVNKALIQGNLDLARSNLEREGEVGEIKNQIAIIRSSEYAAAKEAFDSAYIRQEAILSKLKPHALIEALAAKAAAADEAAEKLHDEMMQGGKPIESFVGPFTAQKKLFHQRQLKQQAAQQIL